MKDRESHLNCPQPNSTDFSVSKIKSPKRINKQCNIQGSTKSLNTVKIMDIEIENIIANFNEAEK